MSFDPVTAALEEALRMAKEGNLASAYTLSDFIHYAETKGVNLSSKQDRIWYQLTQILEGAKARSTPHIGLHSYRLTKEADNPLEREMSEKWQKEMSHSPCLLRYMLSDEPNKPADFTHRDAAVAATVIQWLGSSVGRGFLKECGYERIEPRKV